jgi:hypothetical protein
VGCFYHNYTVSLYGIRAPRLTSSFSSHMASISSPISLTTLNHQINLKLSRDNYMLWQYLLASYLEGQNLFGYIDNSIPCPLKFISSTIIPSSTSSTTTTDSPTLVPNPDYKVWVRQDKLILSVNISTISEDILVHIVSLHTSRDVWITLEKMFVAQSKAASCKFAFSSLPSRRVLYL